MPLIRKPKYFPFEDCIKISNNFDDSKKIVYKEIQFPKNEKNIRKKVNDKISKNIDNISNKI